MAERSLVSAQNPVLDRYLPSAHGLRDGSVRIFDGATYVARSGLWVRILENEQDGSVAPLPDVPAEPPRPDDEALPQLTYFIVAVYPPSFGDTSVLVPLTDLQSTSTYNAQLIPFRVAEGGWFFSGATGVFPIQAQLTQIHDCPDGSTIDIFTTILRDNRVLPRQHVLTFKSFAGGLRLEHSRAGAGAEGWGNKAVLDLNVGDRFNFEVIYTLPAGHTEPSATDLASAFHLHCFVTPMVVKETDEDVLGGVGIYAITTMSGSFPSELGIEVACNGSPTHVTAQLVYITTYEDAEGVITQETVVNDPSIFQPMDLDNDGGASWTGALPFYPELPPDNTIAYEVLVSAFDENGVGVATSLSQTAYYTA